jgi:hypothetical protein
MRLDLDLGPAIFSDENASIKQSRLGMNIKGHARQALSRSLRPCTQTP